MKKAHAFARASYQEERHEAGQPGPLVFCERGKTVAPFPAQTYVGSGHTFDRIASSFAMQCLVRGQEPENFEVLVPVDGKLAGHLISRAKDLLEEGRETCNSKSLSPRQQEILSSVLCNRANKEIASMLNITVRTVKFHISSLLNKFGVENRGELARKASGSLQSDSQGSPNLEKSVSF